MKVFEVCLSATITAYAPWYVVPADVKKNARLIVSQIILDTLKELGMNYPTVDKETPQRVAGHPQSTLRPNATDGRLNHEYELTALE